MNHRFSSPALQENTLTAQTVGDGPKKAPNGPKSVETDSCCIILTEKLGDIK